MGGGMGMNQGGGMGMNQGGGMGGGMGVPQMQQQQRYSGVGYGGGR